jgi:hypothetical protein
MIVTIVSLAGRSRCHWPISLLSSRIDLTIVAPGKVARPGIRCSDNRIRVRRSCGTVN